MTALTLGESGTVEDVATRISNIRLDDHGTLMLYHVSTAKGESFSLSVSDSELEGIRTQNGIVTSVSMQPAHAPLSTRLLNSTPGLDFRRLSAAMSGALILFTSAGTRF